MIERHYSPDNHIANAAVFEWPAVISHYYGLGMFDEYDVDFGGKGR
jgi:hypothetical protein